MVDVEFYRLYNGLRARNLMPCLCRDFCDFHKSLPCFLPFFAVIFYCPYVSICNPLVLVVPATLFDLFDFHFVFIAYVGGVGSSGKLLFFFECDCFSVISSFPCLTYLLLIIKHSMKFVCVLGMPISFNLLNV